MLVQLVSAQLSRWVSSIAASCFPVSLMNRIGLCVLSFLSCSRRCWYLQTEIAVVFSSWFMSVIGLVWKIFGRSAKYAVNRWWNCKLHVGSHSAIQRNQYHFSVKRYPFSQYWQGWW